MILRANMSIPSASHFPATLMWFRRDLRAQDNAALSQALQRSDSVHGVFVFDKPILDPLPRQDRRVEFIRESLVDLDQQLQKLSGQAAGGLIVMVGDALDIIPQLAKKLGVVAVFTNHDDEPDALARDAKVRGGLANIGVGFYTYKDHVIFERAEVLTQNRQPYGVFTPYKNTWLKYVQESDLAPHPIDAFAKKLATRPTAFQKQVPTLKEIGFEKTNLDQLQIPCGIQGAKKLFNEFLKRMSRYEETRNFPAVKGPSYLSVHLRFGTISIRQLARAAHASHMLGDEGAQTWLSELIWRDFYHQILFHHPHVVSGAFKREYNSIVWEHGKIAEKLFNAWCEGKTGYPLIDASMMQINQTGYMHNRLRMVVASFLVKDLGIDWRWGEAYFAKHLNDFDLAANNGGWQWASSSGCDAQPYFRIFNPISQSEKFDAQAKFIKRYLPQLSALSDDAIHAPWLAKPIDLKAAGIELGKDNPMPIVDHATARAKTLERYAVIKKNK